MISPSNLISSASEMSSAPSSARFASFVASSLRSALFNKPFALRGEKAPRFHHILHQATGPAPSFVQDENARSSVQASPATFRQRWLNTGLPS